MTGPEILGFVAVAPLFIVMWAACFSLVAVLLKDLWDRLK
jgi:hypothetical protein